MAKGKNKDKTIHVTIGSADASAVAKLLDSNLPKEDFIAANITDEFCNYTYEIKQGVGIGNVHSVKGKAIAHPDLINAMMVLNRHMACIDGSYKLAGYTFNNIDELENDLLTANYDVNGFRSKGSEDSLAVILTGTKTVAPIGQMEIKTPKVDISEMSSYPWYNELRDAINEVKKEVRLYHEGKCVQETEEVDPNQAEIDFNLEEAKQD